MFIRTQNSYGTRKYTEYSKNPEKQEQNRRHYTINSEVYYKTMLNNFPGKGKNTDQQKQKNGMESPEINLHNCCQPTFDDQYLMLEKGYFSINHAGEI